MTTFTSAEVNGWFQTIDGLPATTASISIIVPETRISAS